MYLYSGYSANITLGKEMGVDEESSKNYIERRVCSRSSHKFFYVLFSATWSFLLGLYWNKQQKEHMQERSY